MRSHSLPFVNKHPRNAITEHLIRNLTITLLEPKIQNDFHSCHRINWTCCKSSPHLICIELSNKSDPIGISHPLDPPIASYHLQRPYYSSPPTCHHRCQINTPHLQRQFTMVQPTLFHQACTRHPLQRSRNHQSCRRIF